MPNQVTIYSPEKYDYEGFASRIVLEFEEAQDLGLFLQKFSRDSNQYSGLNIIRQRTALYIEPGALSEETKNIETPGIYLIAGELTIAFLNEEVRDAFRTSLGLEEMTRISDKDFYLLTFRSQYLDHGYRKPSSKKIITNLNLDYLREIDFDASSTHTFSPTSPQENLEETFKFLRRPFRPIRRKPTMVSVETQTDDLEYEDETQAESSTPAVPTAYDTSLNITNLLVEVENLMEFQPENKKGEKIFSIDGINICQTDELLFIKKVAASARRVSTGIYWRRKEQIIFHNNEEVKTEGEPLPASEAYILLEELSENKEILFNKILSDLVLLPDINPFRNFVSIFGTKRIINSINDKNQDIFSYLREKIENKEIDLRRANQLSSLLSIQATSGDQQDHISKRVYTEFTAPLFTQSSSANPSESIDHGEEGGAAAQNDSHQTQKKPGFFRKRFSSDPNLSSREAVERPYFLSHPDTGAAEESPILTMEEIDDLMSITEDRPDLRKKDERLTERKILYKEKEKEIEREISQFDDLTNTTANKPDPKEKDERKILVKGIKISQNERMTTVTKESKASIYFIRKTKEKYFDEGNGLGETGSRGLAREILQELFKHKDEILKEILFNIKKTEDFRSFVDKVGAEKVMELSEEKGINIFTHFAPLSYVDNPLLNIATCYSMLIYSAQDKKNYPLAKKIDDAFSIVQIPQSYDDTPSPSPIAPSAAAQPTRNTANTRFSTPQ